MYLFVRINDICEFDARRIRITTMNLDSPVARVDLTDTIDGAHNKLVEVSAEEKAGLKTKGH